MATTTRSGRIVRAPEKFTYNSMDEIVVGKEAEKRFRDDDDWNCKSDSEDDSTGSLDEFVCDDDDVDESEPLIDEDDEKEFDPKEEDTDDEEDTLDLSLDDDDDSVESFSGSDSDSEPEPTPTIVLNIVNTPQDL